MTGKRKVATMAQPMTAIHYNALEFRGIEISDIRRTELLTWLSGIDAPNVAPVLRQSARLILEPASADASFRRYFRLYAHDTTWVIMDAPVTLEATEPFVRVSGLLRGAGINTPTVDAWGRESGFVLLEDFGDTTYLRKRLELSPVDGLRSSTSEADCATPLSTPSDVVHDELLTLYRQAIDALVRMQANIAGDGLPSYDVKLLNTEMELFRYWLVLRHVNGGWSMNDERAWNATKHALISDALAQETVVVHRDYHSRNLMVVEAHNPGVLDFQDAVNGPIFYDVVSLLKDCYARFDDATQNSLLDYYFAQMGNTTLTTVDNASNRRLFHTMGMQRHIKAAGIFARLWHRDKKPHYLEDIPRTLNYIVEVARQDPRFEWLANLIHTRIFPSLLAQESSC